MNKPQIIKSLIPGALLSYERYNILPSLTIAQAILETGWLQHVKGNNIFGIKWTAGCGYEVQEINTHEWINGVKTPMVCNFRKYDSLEDSLLDHGKLLNFSRYKSVITSKDYKEACQNVYASGYCTDHEYPKKLIAIIEENKLYIYDAAPKSEISKNTSAEDIKYLQKCLNLMKIRYIQWRIGFAMDGIYGHETARLVNAYQKNNKLAADGIVGNDTWHRLLS
jgi:flagellum-specific peptidoglycan hydrolase FlgJ